MTTDTFTINNPNNNINLNIANNFFFCYSINLLRYLRNNNIENIAKGVNPKTNRIYWMFQRSNELDTYLNLYKQKG